MKIFKTRASASEDRKEDVNGGSAFVGRFSYGASNIRLHASNQDAALYIGRYCSIAASVEIFLGGNHRVDWITTFPFGHIFQEELGGESIVGHPHTRGDVRIGNDVWIGQGATIMSGVSIGDGAVIAANAHVVSDVPPYTIVGGNPARAIKRRFDDALIERLLCLRWWEFSAAEVKKLASSLSSAPSAALLEELLARTAALPRDFCEWAGAKKMY
jgi:acetyltransferase-like isoleucine patch superfamily enzyme